MYLTMKTINPYSPMLSCSLFQYCCMISHELNGTRELWAFLQLFIFPAFVSK